VWAETISGKTGLLSVIKTSTIGYTISYKINLYIVSFRVSKRYDSQHGSSPLTSETQPFAVALISVSENRARAVPKQVTLPAPGDAVLRKNPFWHAAETHNLERNEETRQELRNKRQNLPFSTASRE
jgi:hypothetical protein